MKNYISIEVNINKQPKSFFVLWPNKEAELYISKEKVSDITTKIKDIENRKRGNRKAALKIESIDDLDLLMAISSRIIDIKSQAIEN